MRMFLVGLMCVLFSGAGFAQMQSVKVPTKSFAENADNLTSGTVNVERLPVGEGSGKVAAGDDKRFNTVSLGRPDDATVVEGRALMWIE